MASHKQWNLVVAVGTTLAILGLSGCRSAGPATRATTSDLSSGCDTVVGGIQEHEGFTRFEDQMTQNDPGTFTVSPLVGPMLNSEVFPRELDGLPAQGGVTHGGETDVLYADSVQDELSLSKFFDSGGLILAEVPIGDHETTMVDEMNKTFPKLVVNVSVGTFPGIIIYGDAFDETNLRVHRIVWTTATSNVFLQGHRDANDLLIVARNLVCSSPG